MAKRQISIFQPVTTRLPPVITEPWTTPPICTCYGVRGLPGNPSTLTWAIL